MATDYPAAHSMDTCWFGTDRDGHIGYFETYEAGALPFAAGAVRNPYRLSDRLAALLPRTEAVYDLAGRVCPGPLAAGGVHRAASNADRDDMYLFFLTSAGPVRAEIASGQAVRLPGHGGAAFLIKGVTTALRKRLHDAGACLGCFWYHERGEDEPPEPAAFGLFEYDHMTENWISGPYGRQVRPRRPAHIDQLPAALRREVGRVSFDFTFARRPYIQPVDHDQTSSWEPAYLTCDGKRIRENTEAIADDYAPDTYALLHAGWISRSDGWLHGITIDPPDLDDED